MQKVFFCFTLILFEAHRKDILGTLRAKVTDNLSYYDVNQCQTSFEEKHFKFIDQRRQSKQIAVVRESNHMNGDSVKNVKHNSVQLVKIYLHFVDSDVLLQRFQ